MSVEAIAKARAEARLARARMEADVATLRDRLNPANAVRDAREQAVATVQRKPAVVAGVAGVAVLLLLLPPLRRAARAAGRFGWRNRVAIGRFIETRRSEKKDDMP